MLGRRAAGLGGLENRLLLLRLLLSRLLLARLLRLSLLLLRWPLLLLLVADHRRRYGHLRGVHHHGRRLGKQVAPAAHAMAAKKQ